VADLRRCLPTTSVTGVHLMSASSARFYFLVSSHEVLQNLILPQMVAEKQQENKQNRLQQGNFIILPQER